MTEKQVDIKKIQIIAEADIRNGNKKKLIDLMPGLIESEKYEQCEGIKRALNNTQENRDR